MTARTRTAMRVEVASRLGARDGASPARWLRHACVAVALLGAPAAAQAANFSTGGTFLPLGHGARAHGLGGAGSALFRDDAAVYWNAANLAWIASRAGATFMHANMLPGVSDGYQSGSIAHAPGPVIGEPEQVLRPHRFGYGLFVSHMGFDFDSGATWGETTFLVGFGYAFTNFASLGVGVKALRVANDFVEADASGSGLDVSLSVLVTNWLSAAIVGRDVWTRVRWDTSNWETLEPAMTVGLEVRPTPRWTVVGDFMLRESTTQRLGFGVEWQAYRDLLWLRGGLTGVTPGETRVYPSFGVGVLYGHVRVDYAASFDHEDALETGHRVSVGLLF